jgi:hypothetical protein
MEKETFPYIERFTVWELGDRSVGESDNRPLQVGFFFKEPIEFDDDTEASRLEFLEELEKLLANWWNKYSDKQREYITAVSDTANKIRRNEFMEDDENWE